ncbi:DUF4145 domain-containing protein [Propionivibrio sp.]|uniref:DUF4145 domain-containing protein n=1 Tax=Propionivibrio sp. TaxID=2212460 RepID=UPI0025F1D6E7|nr:DUF4145 domain-containing protein [Propionivibrio sp.]MBK7356382.1 DUF4145 domain-containing protein [Propionivibrio sp.]
MTTKRTPPSTTETAFDCPHCGAFTTQHWFKLHANHIDKEHRVPTIPGAEMVENIRHAKELEEEMRQNLLEWVRKMDSGLVFLDQNKQGSYIYNDVNNLFLSQCYNCKKVAVWVHQNLVFPAHRLGPEPNADLPEAIVQDFEEARTILNYSPRGAAALLRLSIQKLCAFLGEKGKNIDDDIASLVSKGLNPLVQKSLDVVRVIGNEAVHPGVIDLKDDPDTALRLLGLVNIIAEQMISHPKAIREMYEQLPEGKKQAIEQRNEKALKGATP